MPSRKTTPSAPTPFEVDYHPYVFQDGRLIGEFERMYQEATVVPWHQDRVAEAWPTHVMLSMLRPGAPFDTALDIGCGLGYATARLAELCGRTRGVDISPTAIDRARTLFPNLEFEVLDIRTPPRQALGPFSLVVSKEVLWFVIPELSEVLDRLKVMVRPGGWLLMCQSFPPLDRPFYGKDALSNPDHLMQLLTSRMTPLASCVCMEHDRPGNGPTLIALLRRHD